MNGIDVIKQMRKVAHCAVCGRIIPWERRKSNTCRESCRKIRKDVIRKDAARKRRSISRDNVDSNG